MHALYANPTWVHGSSSALLSERTKHSRWEQTTHFIYFGEFFSKISIHFAFFQVDFSFIATVISTACSAIFLLFEDQHIELGVHSV